MVWFVDHVNNPYFSFTKTNKQMRRFTFFTLVVAGLFMATSCNQNKMNSTSYSYLALGDSYTIGESVPEQERYPVQLADSLKKNGIEISDVKIIAKTGWTTDELQLGIDTAVVKEEYDLVTLLIGVNNQYRGRDVENYREEFKALLHRATAFASGNKDKVIVISIPDWGVTPFAEGRDKEQIAQEIDTYNSVNLEETTNAGVAYVDVTGISRMAVTQPDLIASDGLHPSGKMYTLWVKEIYPLAKEILMKGGSNE